MAGKYADRFRQLPPANAPDVLDLGGADRRSDDHDHDDVLSLEPAAGRPWHRSWVARSMLVVALVAGATGGAIGWERWKVHEADVASRSAVDLVASALTLNYSADDVVAIALSYRNEGEHEVVVRDVRFQDDRLTLLSDPEVLRIGPGDTASQIFSVRAICPSPPSDPVELPRLIVVTVETVDGAVRDHPIESDLVNAEIGEWFTYACQSQYYQPSFGDSYAEFWAATPSADGTAVETLINFGLGDGIRVQVDGVEPATGAFSVEYTVDDAASSDSFVTPPIMVTYRVDDCRIALESSDRDMALVIAGVVEGTAPGEITAFPSPELAIELTRLVQRSC